MFTPSFQGLEVILEWSFESEQVISMPAVGDIDGDTIPEVVVNTYYATDPGGGSAEYFGEIIVLDGTNGAEQFRIEHDPDAGSYGSYARSTVGIADVDGNGLADVVYVGRPEVGIDPFDNNSSIVHAVNGIGQHLWSSHAPDGSPYYIYIRHGGPSFGNFDTDDETEIVYGTAVIDNDGTVVFDQDGVWMLGGGVFGSNGNYLGGLSAIADLTGDGYPEIVSGRHAWTVSWNQVGMNPPLVQLNLLWEYADPDGFPAIADLDQDGDPEVVLVGDPAPFSSPYDGQVQVLDGATGELWCGVDPTDAMCQADPGLRTQPLLVRDGGRGGPPVVADFDGDGRPEIALAGGSAYTVYDLNRAGEDVVQPAGDPLPEGGALYARWTSTIQDESSNNTGSSAFDFQGDGVVEALFGDECYLRVYDGQTGNILLEQESSSSTIREYPFVADVDGDGEPELVVVANDAYADSDCGSIPGYTPRRGVFVYGTVANPWMRTRQVWNSHTYHVTNATSDGRTPIVESNNWEDSALNSYRSNVVDRSAYNSPDLQADIIIINDGCPEGQLSIITTVRNTGAIGVAEGIEVSLFEGLDTSGTPLDGQLTGEWLAPGGSVDLLWIVPAPNAPTNFSIAVDVANVIGECNESNNESVSASVSC